jgi:hypothetical protein
MADKSNNWAMVDLSAQPGGAELVLYVEGTEIPVAQFSMSYGVNSIPTATALVALGRDARTGMESAIYAKVDAIKQMAAVRVFIRGSLGDWSPRGENGAKESFPIGANATIFIGYVSGISYRRSAGRISLVLNLVNQLVDLALSSGGSKDVVPGAPNDLMLSVYPEGAGTSATAAEKFTEDLPAALPVDFSEGILTVLDKVSADNQVQYHDPDFWCGGLPADAPINDKGANGMAASVIAGKGRWQGISNFAKGTDVDNYVKPYPLKVHSSGYDKASTFIGNQIANSLAGTSMWQSLISSLLPSFGCGVIPWAAGAIVAPILPMARDAQITIKAEEYVDFDLTTQSQRPLYGVGILANYQMGTINKAGDSKLCAGASYVAKSQNGIPFNDGMWLFVNAPGWMDDWVNFDPEAADGDADINKTLNQPSHDATGADKPAIERSPDEEVVEWNNSMQQYAQMIYAANALNGREGAIVGKLRFDIAPATTVLIQARGDTHLSEGVDTLATDMYGFVAKVHISINAEQASATTAFELTNLRTAEENKSERFSMIEHPFFMQNYFKYAPLVPRLTKPIKDTRVVGVGNKDDNNVAVTSGEGDQTNAVAGPVDDTGTQRVLGPVDENGMQLVTGPVDQTGMPLPLAQTDTTDMQRVANVVDVYQSSITLPTEDTKNLIVQGDPGESGQTIIE